MKPWQPRLKIEWVTTDELWQEIDDKCRRHLGMTGLAFVDRYHQEGPMCDTFHEADVGLLYRMWRDHVVQVES